MAAYQQAELLAAPCRQISKTDKPFLKDNCCYQSTHHKKSSCHWPPTLLPAYVMPANPLSPSFFFFSGGAAQYRSSFSAQFFSNYCSAALHMTPLQGTQSFGCSDRVVSSIHSATLCSNGSFGNPLWTGAQSRLNPLSPHLTRLDEDAATCVMSSHYSMWQ